MVTAATGRWRTGLLRGVVALACLAGASAAKADCTDLLAAPGGTAAARRLITAQDLIGLRDIGLPDPSFTAMPSPLGVSPDRRRIAFVINRADLESNGYCRGLVVLDLRPGTLPHIVDRGGALITMKDVQQGLLITSGFPDLVIPGWSPDGRWIAYLKRANGLTQLWRVRADGGAAEQVSHAPVDVEAWAWSADGGSLVFASKPGRLEAERQRDAEARSGYLYDDRFSPDMASRPQLRANLPRVADVADLANGAIRPATPAEAALLPPEGVAGLAPEPVAYSADGRVARAVHKDASLLGERRIVVTDPHGRALACAADTCVGSITGLWWANDGGALLFLRRQGWNKGEMALYRWVPGSATPRRILLTRDAIEGCAPAGARLVCMRENATTPRRLILLDPRSGRSALLYDPNPAFASIDLGRVERLFWRNDIGLEAWGDLVLPPGYRADTKLPMVVVQYTSNGFLRGGTGDEYPIYLLAAHGFAVLSLQDPPFFSSAFPNLSTAEQINAANTKNWAERRSLLSSLVTGVGQAIARGIADPARIGITGLSDGASTARFALINTRLFAAAAISSCCLEPKTVMTYGGIAWADANRRIGYPPATKDDPDFWRPYSFALNAARIDTPILMQLADDEYLLSLEAFTALREQNKPVEMYVFPDEHHVKWQPVHRLAIDSRTLDWFAFWLQAREDPDPVKAAQYRRWEAMRARLAANRVRTAPAVAAPSSAP